MNRHREMLYLQTFPQRASAIRNCTTLALLVGFWFACFQKEANKSSGDSTFLLLFLLTQQITLTNRTRTSSALLKRCECKTKVTLVRNCHDITPRWFAFLWKQLHVLGPGLGSHCRMPPPSVEPGSSATTSRRYVVGNIYGELGRSSVTHRKPSTELCKDRGSSMELLRSP